MPELTDKELETSVARVLLTGVLLAALIVCVGGALYLLHPPAQPRNYTQFHAQNPALATLAATWHGALHGNPPSLIQLGLMVLIATPVARVALCLLGFARQRDKLYSLISAAVLVILLYSFIGNAR